VLSGKAFPASGVPKEIKAVVDKTEKVLSSGPLLCRIKHSLLLGKDKPMEGSLPSEVKILMDKWGKVYYESKTILPKDRVLKDEKGKIIKPEDVKPSISLYDGQFQWLYDPVLNIYTRRRISKELALSMRYFNLECFMCTNHLLKNSLPYLKSASLMKEKFKGKDALLIVLTYPGGDERRYWIDEKTHLPLQSEYLHPTKSGTYIERYEVVELVLNPRISKGAFSFKPPKGAKEVDWETFNKLENRQ